MKRVLFLLLAVPFIMGCQVKKMGSTEVGVMVTNLPPSLGGGISEIVIPSGKVKIYPWFKDLYTVDTGVKAMS